MRSIPSTASTAASSSANDAGGSPRRPRSRPYALTFCPSSVTSRDALGCHPLDLADERGERTRDLAPARRGHDAVGADHVAADRDLQPALELARPLLRQVAREALELEVALRRQRVAREELGELVHLARSERDVDEREALEHLVLDRLRPAAADADHDLRPLALASLRMAQMGDELGVGRLADRARVEEDQVRLVRVRRLAVPERLEHPLHALRVVLVHLAAERRDVVALHPDPGYRAPYLRVLDRARLADHRDLDLPRVLQLLLDLARDLVREQRRARRRRSLVGRDHHADLAAGLHRVDLVDAVVAGGDLLEVAQASDVAAPATRRERRGARRRARRRPARSRPRPSAARPRCGAPPSRGRRPPTRRGGARGRRRRARAGLRSRARRPCRCRAAAPRAAPFSAMAPSSCAISAASREHSTECASTFCP